MVFAVLLLAACSSPAVKQSQSYVEQEQWLKAVLTLRKAHAADPSNVEFKSRLKQIELKAADYYYQRGLRLEQQGNLEAAAVEYQQGLTAMPDHHKLTSAMSELVAKQEGLQLYREAAQYESAGKQNLAKGLLLRAQKLYPDHPKIKDALLRLKVKEEADAANRLVLKSKAPITLNFRRTNIKTAFEFVAKSFGLNIIFDEQVKNAPVTLFAKGVTFDQALNLMLTTTETFYKKIGPNTILVAPDNESKRGQYEDYIIRTFHLSTVKAKDMSDILKGVLNLKKIVINSELNSLLIRDTQEKIKLAEELISINDRKSAEVIFDVEILEVNRTKAEQLGLDIGSRITASLPDFIIGSGSLAASFAAGVVTLPQLTFNFFKQDVDAKTLANPKVRVIDGKVAKIHIGDRVPLRSSTVQDATGQIRNTYDYKEIGIRLNVEPQIHLDNSTTVKLGLEVSSLGANLGTKDDPSYSIGTRNADTYMLLRDGETAILGGLIRDEDRRNKIRIPGLGDIPLVGNVFTSHDNSSGRTDVLLTITARVVRSWDLPDKQKLALFSGTEKTYSSKPLFAYLQTRTGGGDQPQISLEGGGDAGQAKPGNGSAVQVARRIPGVPGQPSLTFSEGVYNAQSGQEFEIRLVASDLGKVDRLPIEILFNPQLTQFVKGESSLSGAQGFKVKADAAKGVLQVDMRLGKAGTKPGVPVELARIVMKGRKPGVSYLVYRTPKLTTRDGKPVQTQVRASRVVVK